jgi:hypothetical protein
MSQGFRTDIQALRGLAVSLVLLYHAGFDFFGAGFLGDVFFVISGFLITDMVRKEVEAGRFSFINFISGAPSGCCRRPTSPSWRRRRWRPSCSTPRSCRISQGRSSGR